MTNLRTWLIYAICTLMAFGILASCNRLEEGIVVGKHYEPMRRYVQLIPVSISTGKTVVVVMIPHIVTDNEDYVLHIKGVHKGEEVIQQVYTSKECYNKLQRGDSWAKTDDCSLQDNNNTKKRKG